jgi:hypothetical protein
MNTRSRRLRWALLYLALPVMGGLSYGEGRAPLSASGHRVAQLLIVAVVFGLVWLWCALSPLVLMEDPRLTTGARLHLIRHAGEDTPGLFYYASDRDMTPWIWPAEEIHACLGHADAEKTAPSGDRSVLAGNRSLTRWQEWWN